MRISRYMSAWLIGIVICMLAAIGGVFWVQRQKPVPNLVITNAAHCTQMLLRQGIAVNNPPVAIKQITLPQEENAVYQEYLKLQESQHLDLKNHMGQKATLYRFADAKEEKLITLIVCEGQLVSADQTYFDVMPHCEALF